LDLIHHIAADPALRRLARDAADGRRIVARGSAGSSTAFVAAALALVTGRPVVLVVAHLDDADEAADELAAAGVRVVALPAMEALPAESAPSLDLFARRVGAMRRVLALRPGAAGDAPASPPAPSTVIIAPVQALMQAVPDPAVLDRLTLTLVAGRPHPLGGLLRWLEGAGYRRCDAVEEPGDFAVRGGIVDIFPPASLDEQPVPVRLDFFGDQVDRICEIDLDTMASDRALDRVDLVAAEPARAAGDGGARPGDRPVCFLELVPPQAIALLSETIEVTEQARGYYERVTDDRVGGGIFGPPAVMKALQERFASFVEVNQFSAARASADVLVDLPVRPLPAFADDAAEAVRELAGMASGERGTRVAVFCDNDAEQQRLGELLREFAPAEAARVESATRYVHRGFVWGEPPEPRRAGERRPGEVEPGPPGGPPRPSLAVVPYHELLHRYHTRRRTAAGARLRAGRAMDTFLDFEPGDLVVHRDHGIAKFLGLTLMPPGSERLSATQRLREGAPQARPRRGGPAGDAVEEYLTLEFGGGSRVHVPCTKIDQVQKYIGGFRGAPALSVLGGERWRKQKEAVSESVRGLASELLRVRAAREHLPGIRYPADTAWQKEFEAEFPYEETEDQEAALAEIKKDMQDERPMDRLLCGDVGYGKTELAIRAAFKAVEFGKQVAVLVPTTVLAEQHERTFRGRFADYPFRVESLSRFKTTKEINATLAALRTGHIDVIIGTHRLLSKDVRFADLGLVVVDEEQRFGVEHKERLLALRMTVDVLTLSATPIPRTLHMSMLGLRDISSLATAPVDRRAVVTEVIPFNERRIQQAIARELSRDGQVFFVHNRVYNIQSIADLVRRLAPEARVVVGHGQMPPHELEDVMLAFMRRQADILVSTTIIESGIDIPTANTMIINDADRFGLADLHQLRGRVGRYKHRAYCYLLTPNDRPTTDKALKRLRAIEEYSMLGAGFKIAMRDLEIRGAGNILGPEQSGHIAAVGYEMYCQLLERAVKELKGEIVAAPSETSIELGVTGLIPRPYIPSDLRRMEAYRRLATAASPEELARFQSDLAQAYGPPPPPAQRLIDLAELRIAARLLSVRSIAVREQDVVFRTQDAGAVAERMGAAKGTVRILPPKKGETATEVYYRPPENYLEPGTLLSVLRKHLCGGGSPAGAIAESPSGRHRVRERLVEWREHRP
jgi:transcription-repair coupling factor (superfamily II helicase)